jgi:Skp family chaperone for outer membrane proteins
LGLSIQSVFCAILRLQKQRKLKLKTNLKSAPKSSKSKSILCVAGPNSSKKTRPSERNKRQRELANLDADLQRKRREIQEDSSRRRNEEFATIIEKANAAIKKIAEQESYDIVIQDAVTVNPRVDITDKVIQALGK